MNALEKSLRRSSKLVNYLHHARPNNKDIEEVEKWARAIDAAKIVQKYLEGELNC